jgi:hypothetical protein
MKVSSFFRRHIVALFIGIVFIFSPTTALFAASAPAAVPPPDTETRSLILGVDTGTAAAANADRKKALAGLLSRGKQTALEKTKNRLQELGKFGLDFDLVRTPAGFVQILQQQETIPVKGNPPISGSKRRPASSSRREKPEIDRRPLSSTAPISSMSESGRTGRSTKRERRLPSICRETATSTGRLSRPT